MITVKRHRKFETDIHTNYHNVLGIYICWKNKVSYLMTNPLRETFSHISIFMHLFFLNNEMTYKKTLYKLHFSNNF